MMKWKIHQDREIDDPEIDSYTLTTQTDKGGWHTDSGYNGYGLPKNLAQWICDVLNESNKECPYKMDSYGCWCSTTSSNQEN